MGGTSSWLQGERSNRIGKHFNIDSVSTSEQFRKVPPEQRIGNSKDEY